MAQDENAPPASVPPVVTGPTVAELQAQLDELKKQSEGRLRDLQSERVRRQELEQRLPPVPPVPSPGPNNDAPVDELGNVLKPYTAPIAKAVAGLSQELDSIRVEKTQNFLVQKTGKTWAQIEADKDFQSRMFEMVNKYGISGNVYDRTVRAYELMELEDIRTKEVERTRAATVAAGAGLPSGTPPPATPANKEYTAEEFKRMPLAEFDKLSAEGGFRKTPEGKFVYAKSK